LRNLPTECGSETGQTEVNVNKLSHIYQQWAKSQPQIFTPVQISNLPSLNLSKSRQISNL